MRTRSRRAGSNSVPKEDTDIVIDDGLKEGERVIVDGIQKVHPGQQVTATVLPAAAKGPGG